MTNDIIRRKIAEACGWVGIADTPHHGLCGAKDSPSFRRIPNYPESHDAMAEALGTLIAKERVMFAGRLRKILQTPRLGDYHFATDIWELLTATPLQKAEAFLKAKGLWEE